MNRYEGEQQDGQALPSRAQTHRTKKGSSEKTARRAWPWQKKAKQAQADDPSEIAFYDALQTMQEQAAAAAVPQQARGASSEGKRKFWQLSQTAVVILLSGSLVANLGEGALIYKLLKMYEAEKNRFAATQDQKVNQPKQEPVVAPVKQPVSWSEPQKQMFSKEERTGMEARLSALITPDVFQSGALDFVFVPGLNHLSAQHDGGVALSAFIHNGFMKNYQAKQVKIIATLNNTVVLDKTFEQKFDEWTSSDVYLTEWQFGYDDIRDSKVLDALLHDTELQAKLRFDVSISYEHEKFPARPDVKEDIWLYLNAKTLAEKKSGK